MVEFVMKGALGIQTFPQAGIKVAKLSTEYKETEILDIEISPSTGVYSRLKIG